MAIWWRGQLYLVWGERAVIYFYRNVSAYQFFVVVEFETKDETGERKAVP